MVGGREHLGRAGALDDASGVHREHAVGDLGDHAEVVGDEHDGGPVVVLQPCEQVEQLGLHRHVEGGGRFVGDQQLRPQGQRHRQHHPLAHAARELVRIVVDPAGGVDEPDLLEQRDRSLLGLGAADPLVGADRLDDLAPDAVLRVQARQRVLEHHRDLGAAHAAHRLGPETEQVGAVEAHLAGDRGVGEESQDGLRGDGLARAGLADDAHRLAGSDVERDAAHGLDVTVLGRERHPQVTD